MRFAEHPNFVELNNSRTGSTVVWAENDYFNFPRVEKMTLNGEDFYLYMLSMNVRPLEDDELISHAELCFLQMGGKL